MLKILLRPFAYLSIQHKDSIYLWINWGVPALIALATTLCWFIPAAFEYFVFPKPNHVDIWSNSGLINKIQSFVQNLPGFYTAALAAVATFGGKDMLKVMPGKAPKMRFLVERQLTEPLDLSRRLFLSSMFAYLTALSFILTVSAAIGITVAPAVKSVLRVELIPYLSAVATGTYVLFFIQMLTITGWGIYYLGERMHLNDGPDKGTQ